MDVKFLVSSVFLDKLRVPTKKERYKLINSERWGSFRDIFGKNNLGFVLAKDVYEESFGGKKSPVYSFNEDLSPYVSSEGLDSKLFMLSSFSLTEERFSTREEIEKMINYVENLQKNGNIEFLVNSPRGTISEDKISVLELQENGFKTPSSFYFKNFSNLQGFFENNSGNLVMKPRFGQTGRKINLIGSENFKNFNHSNIGDFIFQEELEILNEKRIIVFNGEFLGSRIIYDRTHPWEDQKIAGRKHSEEKYLATDQEIDDTIKVMDFFDVELGCVDWIEVKDKGRFYLEYNGVATGYGIGKHPYNLNKVVAKKLKEKYL